MRPKLSTPPSTPPLGGNARPPPSKPLRSRPAVGAATAALLGIATGGCTMAIGRAAFHTDAGPDAAQAETDGGIEP